MEVINSGVFAVFQNGGVGNGDLKTNPKKNRRTINVVADARNIR